MIYNFVKALIRIFVSLIFSLEVSGRENIPEGGGYLVCSNHSSNWDPVTVTLAIDKRLSYIAKEELFRFAPFGALIKTLGAIPVKRGGGGAAAVLAAVDLLKNGGIITMFPEGTRVKDGRKIRPKSGAVRIARTNNIPILPVGISGGYKLFGRISVNIGKPMFFSDGEDAAAQTETLMDEIYKRAKV